MFGMWDVREVGCSRGGMFGMWDVRGVGCSGCGMFGVWDVRDVGCWGCGMFGVWDVRDVGCLGCGMWDVGCLPGCGMLIYKMSFFYIICFPLLFLDLYCIFVLPPNLLILVNDVYVFRIFLQKTRSLFKLFFQIGTSFILPRFITFFCLFYIDVLISDSYWHNL